jgi:GAF domain-containing protein
MAEVRPFEEKHIALLKAFADQAAIAIENVRLFNAEQQRTRELKHIFIGIDGTWQAAYSDMFSSNVYRMNVALNHSERLVAPIVE